MAWVDWCGCCQASLESSLIKCPPKAIARGTGVHDDHSKPPWASRIGFPNLLSLGIKGWPLINSDINNHQQRLYVLEEQVKAMTRALQKEHREHELTKKALELSRRTTEQMHAVWDDVMSNPLVIPNYMYAHDADVHAQEDEDEDPRQEVEPEAERGTLMPLANATEEEEDNEEEEDREELDQPAPHDPRDPPNPPNDPFNPPATTNTSHNTDTNPNTDTKNNTTTDNTNEQVSQDDGELAWTHEQQRTIALMVKAGYTREEAAAAIRASLPSQVQEDPNQEETLQEDQDRPTQRSQGEASTYDEIM